MNRLLPILAALPAAADPVEDRARAALAAMQGPSFAAGVEYCAYLVEGPGGTLRLPPVTRGEPDSCYAADWAEDETPRASLHTHGGWDPDAWSEIPSDTDVIGDMAEGIDGYVATPGGRFWFVDGAAGTVHLLCGVGCLPQDPDFRSDPDGPFDAFYALDDLRTIFAE